MRGLGCWTVGNSGGTAEIILVFVPFYSRDEDFFIPGDLNQYFLEALKAQYQRKEVEK